jgi:hypothetical protein
VAYNAGPGAVGRASLPAETTKYIDIILNGKTPPVSSATPPAASSPISAAQSAEQAFAPITLPARPVRQITAPTAPGFAAQPTTPTGARATPSAPQIRTPRLDVNAALNALAASSSQAQSQPQTQPQTQDAGSTAPARGGDGSFKISGPNPGRLQPHLVSFAKRVANQLGMNLVGLDGSTHSKYTTTGNVSQHYTGNATDIFTINGKSLKQHPQLLIQAGRAALIAAGMNPAKARKAGIGLYNVGEHQIIFGTNSPALGGDHTDHLHISAR